MIRNNNEITITEEESKTCKLCGKIFESNRKMIWHVRKEHNLNFENYIIQTYHGGIRPVCLKTGNPLSFKAHKLGPWFKNFSKNNFLRKPHTEETKRKIKEGCEKTSMKKFGVKNVFETKWCQEKIKKTWIKKYGVDNPAKHETIKKKSLQSYYDTLKEKYKDVSYIVNCRESSLEKDFENKLNGAQISFSHPFLLEGKKFDFLIKDINLVVEIDGETYHKDNLENLFFGNIIVALNDYYKNNLILQNSPYNLVRIRYFPSEFIFSNLQELTNLIDKFKYNPDYSVNYKQKIYTKKYLFNIKKNLGENTLKKMINKLLQFIRTFQPTLPYPDLEENLSDITEKISKTDISKLYNSETKEFYGNISKVGNNYLKHYFHSYWKSKFNGNPSPTEAWLDDKIMKDVIEYRIGCNNSGEIFDFSLHQLVRGLSARRITVSFFSPLLSAAIYNVLLGDIPNPKVLDPCCGFGGRLLGFKSKYPDGTYIGCEPNVETYNELMLLVKHAGWESSVKIYNCKFEDFDDNNETFDLIFTSIPYYDTEIYSNHTSYNSFDEWRQTFIKSLKKYSGKKCYINVPVDLAQKLNWNNVVYTVKKPSSHFNKEKKDKTEYIIEL